MAGNSRPLPPTDENQPPYHRPAKKPPDPSFSPLRGAVQVLCRHPHTAKSSLGCPICYWLLFARPFFRVKPKQGRQSTTKKRTHRSQRPKQYRNNHFCNLPDHVGRYINWRIRSSLRAGFEIRHCFSCSFDPPDHKLHTAEEEPCLGTQLGGFEVLGQPSVAVEPAKRPFEHLAAGQRLEASRPIQAPDDLKVPTAAAG